MTYKKEDKVPLQVLDPTFIEGMAWVQSIGNRKHKDNHWTNGVSVSEILAGVKRHIAAIEKGDYFDDESTLQHAYHAACGMQYIAYYVRNSFRYRKFFDQPFGGPPDSSNQVGEPGLPYALDPGCFSETPGGSGGAVQRSDRGGTSGRSNPNSGSFLLSRGPAWTSGNEENED